MEFEEDFRFGLLNDKYPRPSKWKKSKNTRVTLTRKRVHLGQTPFRVIGDPEISQLDAKYDPELGQSDPIICQFD